MQNEQIQYCWAHYFLATGHPLWENGKPKRIFFTIFKTAFEPSFNNSNSTGGLTQKEFDVSCLFDSHFIRHPNPNILKYSEIEISKHNIFPRKHDKFLAFLCSIQGEWHYFEMNFAIAIWWSLQIWLWWNRTSLTFSPNHNVKSLMLACS